MDVVFIMLLFYFTFMSLFGPKRRSKSRGHGGGKTLDTVLAIGALGAIGVAGYFVLKSGKGFEESLQTGGDFLKDLVDAANSTGDYIADGSYWLQKQLGIGSGSGGGGSKPKGEEKGILEKLQDAAGAHFKPLEEHLGKEEKRAAEGRNAVGEFFGNKACHLQKIFNPGLKCG